VDDISYDVGYDDASFFRRLFKRRTGLKPIEYRRVFKPMGQAGRPPRASRAATRPDDHHHQELASVEES
jgi:AraC-like DNA-binding protein